MVILRARKVYFILPFREVLKALKQKSKHGFAENKTKAGQ